MTSAQSLADAIAGLAVEQVAATPAVHGADWQTATVTAVNTTGSAAGTVDCGQIRARRLASYSSPSVGDLIVIHRSGAGNWITPGRLSDGTDGWIAPTLTSPWANYGSPYQSVRYRRIGDVVSIQGLINSGTTSVSGTSTAFTLPAGYRPAAVLVFAALAAGPALRQLEVTDGGVVRLANLPAGVVSWVSLTCTFMI